MGGIPQWAVDSVPPLVCRYTGAESRPFTRGEMCWRKLEGEVKPMEKAIDLIESPDERQGARWRDLIRHSQM